MEHREDRDSMGREMWTDAIEELIASGEAKEDERRLLEAFALRLSDEQKGGYKEALRQELHEVRERSNRPTPAMRDVMVEHSSTDDNNRYAA